MELNGKTALITGATGGIGREIALALAARGMNLALVARTAASLDGLAGEIRAIGSQVITLPTDIRIEKDVQTAVDAALEKFAAVDVLVNSAFWGPPASLEDTTEAFWDQTIDTSLKAPYLFSRAVVPAMKRLGSGRIVNIGSKAGKVGEDNRTAYCAAKWGLEGLTAALQEELTRYNIHVHLVSPAATLTSWWDTVTTLQEQSKERMIPPQVVAEAVCWVLQQPDQVHIPDVPVYNFRNPFEGKSSPFEKD